MWYFFIPCFFIILICIAVSICGSSNSCSSCRDPNLETAAQGKVSKIEYKDHTYVVWSINFGGGIVHDPDCKCLKEK